MEKRTVITFIMILSALILSAQEWGHPIDGKVLLSGTFGELRGSHYHGGLDIKPNTDGDQIIRAAADGYIREIMVRGGSYGNALILQHENGYQSLYGHLHRFRADIDSLVYEHQYEMKSFVASIFPDSTALPVKKGDPIGIMGNTGFSFGRHLHFEVRHTNGKIYNPQLFLPPISDQSPPQFRNLRINYYDRKGREYQDKNLSVQRTGRGRYSAGNLTLNALYFSAGVDVIDLHEATHNRNGVYKIQMFKNDQLIYETSFDSLDVIDRKYYNCHVDYKMSEHSIHKYHNLKYRVHPIWEDLTLETSGLSPLLKPYPFQTDQYRIVASDYQGNESQLDFTVKRVNEISLDYDQMYNFVLPSGHNNRVDLDRFSITFPKHTFIRDHRAYIFEEEVIRDNEPFHLIHLGENEVPLFESALLQYKSSMDMEEKKKWTLAACKSSSYQAIPTVRNEDHFAADIRSLNTYCLIKDTIPPVISFHPVNNHRWHFTIKDDLHSFSALKYEGTVNGEWVLVEADDKNNRLIFTDFKRAGSGSHTFRLTVEDGCGNVTRFEQTFHR